MISFDEILKNERNERPEEEAFEMPISNELKKLVSVLSVAMAAYEPKAIRAKICEVSSLLLEDDFDISIVVSKKGTFQSLGKGANFEIVSDSVGSSDVVNFNDKETRNDIAERFLKR